MPVLFCDCNGAAALFHFSHCDIVRRLDIVHVVLVLLRGLEHRLPLRLFLVFAALAHSFQFLAQSIRRLARGLVVVKHRRTVTPRRLQRHL